MMRYERNKTTISSEEQDILKRAKVCVIGCGGLGGYVIEMLGRIGIGAITAIDGDVFDETNLNRQLLSEMSLIGHSKALAAKERMLSVNPEISVNAIHTFFLPENAEALLMGHDVIVDALDQIPARFLLQETAERLNIPFVHGAIAGWYAQISTVFPGEKTLEKIYRKDVVKGKENTLGNPSFTPAYASSVQVSEVIKLLLGRGELLRNKIMFANLLDHEIEIAEL